MSVLT
jgi:NAD(P)-dependent dehydrogenase (short-subunit alcohol dehydrogenase family)